MNEQLKQQAHKEFEKMLDYPSDNNLTSISDEKIMKENEDKHLYNSYAYQESIWEIDDEKVLSFIDSLIDKTVQQIESRLVESLKDYYDEVKNIQIGTGDDKTKELIAISYCIGVLSLITNKSDIDQNV